MKTHIIKALFGILLFYLSGTFAMAKQSQSIIFPEIGKKTCRDSLITLSATSSSGLPVGYSILYGQGKAVLVGNTIRILGPGTLLVEAFQAGNDDWEPASPVRKTIEVTSAFFERNYDVKISTSDSLVCEGESLHLEVNTYAGLSYAWDFNGDTTFYSNVLKIDSVNTKNSGYYMLRFYEGGCVFSPFQFKLKVFLKPKITIAPISNRLFIGSKPIVIEAEPQGGTFSGMGVIGSSFIPSIAGIGLHAISYTYRTSDGCSSQAKAKVSVEADTVSRDTISTPEDSLPRDILVYELISSRKSSRHHTWIIEEIENYSNNEVYIFDSWGTLVFYKKNYSNADGWSADNVGPGSYAYVVHKGDGSLSKKGYLLIEK